MQEMNEGESVCRFLQVWIKPDKRNVKPQYGSRRHEAADRHNRWLHLLGGTGQVPSWKGMSDPSDIRLHQDCNVIVMETDPEQTYEVTLDPGRRMYFVCMEGDVAVNDSMELSARDAMEVISDKEGTPIALRSGASGMHVLGIEMAV